LVKMAPTNATMGFVKLRIDQQFPVDDFSNSEVAPLHRDQREKGEKMLSDFVALCRLMFVSLRVTDKLQLLYFSTSKRACV